MHIGVFDSGIGGKSIADALGQAYPGARISYVHDSEHMPYGDRSAPDVQHLTETAILGLLGCDVIIIACNTATAVAIEYLRKRYPEQLFIGLEPMVKPAVNRTNTGMITICATPATLASKRYYKLKETYAHGIQIYEPDCSDWARMIEHNQIDDRKIAHMVEESRNLNSDVVVLACTHYHWIRSRIEQLAGPNVTVLDPSAAIVSRVAELLPSLRQAQDETE